MGFVVIEKQIVSIACPKRMVEFDVSCQRSKDKKRVRGSNDNLQLGISGASDCLGDSVDQAETERMHSLVDAYLEN